MVVHVKLACKDRKLSEYQTKYHSNYGYKRIRILVKDAFEQSLFLEIYILTDYYIDAVIFV